MSEDKELERLILKKMKEMLHMRSEEGKIGRVIELNDSNFSEEISKSEAPVLVDFWAEWCPPCRIMAPVVEELAEKYAGKLVVAKVNVDESPGIARKYYIRAIPTFIIFVKGKPVERIVGAVGKEGLERVVKKYLK